MPAGPGAVTSATSVPQPGVVADTSASKIEGLQANMHGALSAPAWPELSPTMDESLSAPRAPENIDVCGHAGRSDQEMCTFGESSAKKTAVVLGDSISMTMANPIRLALGEGWIVVVSGMYGCPFSSATVKSDDPKILQACPSRNSDSVDLVNELRPDLVFVSNTYEPRALVVLC